MSNKSVAQDCYEMRRGRETLCRGTVINLGYSPELIRNMARNGGLLVQERKAGEDVSNNVGIDPDKDYLFDPQQRDAFTTRCDWCGHDIYSGEHFSRVPAPLWAREKAGKDEITFCADCLNEITEQFGGFLVI